MSRSARPIRAVIVGAGLMGRWHAHAIRKTGGTVAWVVDRDTERVRKLSSQLGSARVTPDLACALSEAHADVVHVCTPLSSHAELVTLALDAGCHVLVEKPLATCAGSTRELLNYAASRDRLLCPVHQFLFQPGVLDTLRRLPELGTLLHIDAVACSAGAVRGLAEEPDLLIPEILPHPLALVARFCKRPLSSLTWHIEHTRPGEMRAMTSVDAVSVALVISSNGRPTTNSLRLVGTRATAHLDLFHGFAVVERGAASRARKIMQPFSFSTRTLLTASTNLLNRALHDEPAYPGLRELIGRFHQAVRDGKRAPISPDEVLDVAVARDSLAATLMRGGG